MKRTALVLLLAAALPASGALYKWVDASGRVQYSDVPPPPGAGKVEEQKIIKNTIGTGSAPFAVQDAAKRNPVVLWITDCGDLCNRARDYLASRGIPHSVRNPSRADEQAAWAKVSGGSNEVPLLAVGADRTVKGFEQSAWDTALTAAGYPRNAPAIKPQPIPAAQAPAASATPVPSGGAASPAPAADASAPPGAPAQAAAPAPAR